MQLEQYREIDDVETVDRRIEQLRRFEEFIEGEEPSITEAEKFLLEELDELAGGTVMNYYYPVYNYMDMLVGQEIEEKSKERDSLTEELEDRKAEDRLESVFNRIKKEIDSQSAVISSENFLTGRQVEEILESAENELDDAWLEGKIAEDTESPGLMYEVLFRLMYGYGVRLGEALSLEWSDVNFDEGTITFPVFKKTGEDVDEEAKTRVESLDNPEVIGNRLEDWHTARSDTSKDADVFQTSQQKVRRRLKRVSDECDSIEGSLSKTKAFRHSGTTHLTQLGYSIRNISNEYCRHVKYSTTLDIYGSHVGGNPKEVNQDYIKELSEPPIEGRYDEDVQVKEDDDIDELIEKLGL